MDRYVQNTRDALRIGAATATQHRIRELVRLVAKDEEQISGLSPGEQIAVALVLDRACLLPEGMTILQAIDRIGDWLDVAKRLQREGWR